MGENVSNAFQDILLCTFPPKKQSMQDKAGLCSAHFPPSEYTCSQLSLYLTPSLKGEPNTPLPSRQSGRRAHRPPLQRRVGPPLQRERPLGPVHRQHLRSAAVAAGQRLRQRARHRQGLGSLGGVSGGTPHHRFSFRNSRPALGTWHSLTVDGGRPGTA